MYTQGRDQYTNPSKYGITNVTTPACSTTSPANPLGGSSLGCTNASTVAADTSTYLFADTVHQEHPELLLELGRFRISR